MSSFSSKKRGTAETVLGFPGAAASLTKKQRKLAEAEALQTLQNVNIQKIMESKGPVVKCVLLKADGRTEELDVDMTPSLRSCQKILGGELTFLGQWEDLQVILLVSKDQSGDNLPVNKHKLQPPFDEIIAYGDILLTRSDDNGEAAPFAHSEYLTFIDQVIEKWNPPSDDHEEEEEEEDGDGDGDDIEEMDEEEALAEFLPRLIEAFKAENKRDPTEEEIEGFKSQILDGDNDDMLEVILPQLIADFKTETGREPTEDEIEYLKEQVMEGELDEEDDEDDAMELEAVMAQLVPKLVASFVDQNNREPTEAELGVLKDRLEANLKAHASKDEDEDEDEEAYAQIDQQKGF